VRLVEALGSERLVHLDIEADPVLTEDVLEIARDTDAAVAQSLEQEAQTHKVPTVARFDPRSRTRSGEEVMLSVDVARLHFFDLESGVTVG
jgi:multiple sugar transport system ATP-binding protein